MGRIYRLFLISQHPDSKASTSFLVARICRESKRFSSSVKVARDTTSAVRMVASTPGAISYGAQPLVVGQRTIRLLGLSKGNSKKLYTTDDNFRCS